jgi:preprotein translocase subunit SecA
MSKLRHSIRFMQYAQKNPLQLYVLEANKIFEKYKKEVKYNTVRSIINIVNMMKPEEEQQVEREVKDFEL